MLNGISTIDQTVFGLIVGVIIAFFCNTIVAKPVEKHVTKLMNGEY